MSKKTKRSNKGRKGSSVNSGSSKRGRDEVTGLSLEYGEWGVVETDNVYDATSRPLKTFTGESSSNYLIEFEMSKDKLVITTASAYEDGTTQYFQRAFASGRFTYSGERLKKAVFTSAGANNVTLINGRVAYEDAWLQEFDAPKTITNFRSNEAWMIINDSTEEPTYYADFADNPPTDPLSKVGDFSFIREIDNGELFKATWWDTPFATNLI